MLDSLKDFGVLVLSGLGGIVAGAAMGGFAWFIAGSFLLRWLPFQLAETLYNNYMIFIIIGALIGLGAGINFGWSELIIPERKKEPGERIFIARTMTPKNSDSE